MAGRRDEEKMRAFGPSSKLFDLWVDLAVTVLVG